jgi:hypothetical protein
VTSSATREAGGVCASFLEELPDAAAWSFLASRFVADHGPFVGFGQDDFGSAKDVPRENAVHTSRVARGRTGLAEDGGRFGSVVVALITDRGPCGVSPAATYRWACIWP